MVVTYSERIVSFEHMPQFGIWNEVWIAEAALCKPSVETFDCTRAREFLFVNVSRVCGINIVGVCTQ